MPFYGYKCPTHGDFELFNQRGDSWECPYCGESSRRIFSWRNASVLMDHYNPAFGQVISSRRQASELAKAASDRQSEQLGMTVNYELTDIHDHEAAGIDKAELSQVADIG
jgi:putative FmdB family regulatory protein